MSSNGTATNPETRRARRARQPNTITETPIELPSETQAGPPWDHGETRPDGRPWWRHDLFPLELSPPQIVARWEAADRRAEARGGGEHPDVVTVCRWSQEAGTWTESVGRHDLAALDGRTFFRRFGPGRYLLTAWTWTAARTDGARALVAVRGRTFNLGAERDELGELTPDDDDDDAQREPEDEEAPELEAADLGARAYELELRKMELQERRLQMDREHREQRDKWAREDRDRKEARDLEEARRAEDRAERDRRDTREREQWRDHQKAIAEIYTRGGATPAASNPLADAIMGAVASLAAKRLPELLGGSVAAAEGGVLAKLGAQAIEAIGDAIVEVGGPIAMGYAKRAGVNVEQVYQDKNSPTTAPPTADEPNELAQALAEEEEDDDE